MPQEGKKMSSKAAVVVPGQKMLEKFVPKAKGIGQNSLTGVGFGRIARALDTAILKGTIQSIGITIPVIKIRADIIDVFNFAIHNGGISLKKDGFIAVGADKLLATGLNYENFKLPTSFDETIAQANLEAEL